MGRIAKFPSRKKRDVAVFNPLMTIYSSVRNINLIFTLLSSRGKIVSSVSLDLNFLFEFMEEIRDVKRRYWRRICSTSRSCFPKKIYFHISVNTSFCGALVKIMIVNMLLTLTKHFLPPQYRSLNSLYFYLYHVCELCNMRREVSLYYISIYKMFVCSNWSDVWWNIWTNQEPRIELTRIQFKSWLPQQTNNLLVPSEISLIACYAISAQPCREHREDNFNVILTTTFPPMFEWEDRSVTK